ncbi:MAG: hypothetical protein WCT04_04300 [Planctomycetota bacterium]
MDNEDEEFKRFAAKLVDRTCPSCHVTVKLPFLPLPGDEMVCSACNSKLDTTCLDPVSHRIEEIIRKKRPICLGAFSIIFYASHQTVCNICGYTYSKELSACPELVSNANKWYFEPTQKKAARRKLLTFLFAHFDVLKRIAPELREGRIPSTDAELEKLLHSDMMFDSIN